VATHLIDKSALARLHVTAVRSRLEPMLLDGRVATTGVAMLEALFSAQSADDYRRQRMMLDAMPRVGVNEKVIDRALDIQRQMVELGTHRAASVPDLILAATAETNGLVVLHYDGDFDLIASATGHRAEWVVPAGSI
jgi:predicted nucleic acid-binding protein